MSSPVFFAARMPASRAAASTLPLAMVWDSMSFSVALLKPDLSARHGFAEHHRLGGNIHHAGFPARINVCQFLHFNELTL